MLAALSLALVEQFQVDILQQFVLLFYGRLGRRRGGGGGLLLGGGGECGGGGCGGGGGGCGAGLAGLHLVSVAQGRGRSEKLSSLILMLLKKNFCFYHLRLFQKPGILILKSLQLFLVSQQQKIKNVLNFILRHLTYFLSVFLVHLHYFIE